MKELIDIILSFARVVVFGLAVGIAFFVMLELKYKFNKFLKNNKNENK